MFTSYFANLKKIAAEHTDLEPVAISVGIPKWFKGRRELRLAPTWAMLKMSSEDYDRHFATILAGLDPAQLAHDLGDRAVLLCWERPGEPCHRRDVAEWLEQALAIVVPELGIDRAATPSRRPWVPVSETSITRKAATA